MQDDIHDDLQEFLIDWQDQQDHVADLIAKGELTVGDIIFPGFYRLLEGEYANRVFIYCHTSKVDDKPALIFANSMTWIWKDKVKDLKCEPTQPTFPEAIHPVKKVYWYADSGDGPYSTDW